jgi:hypothetical protein
MMPAGAESRWSTSMDEVLHMIVSGVTDVAAAAPVDER